MSSLNASPPDEHTKWKEKDLASEHLRILQYQERYWHQKSRISWAMFGDRNSGFFHAMVVTRKRRNTIRTLRKEDGTWESDGRRIRGMFVTHFRAIYTKVQTFSITQVYPPQMFERILGVPDAAHFHLDALPTEPEVFKALMSLVPNKAVGPDGFTAGLIQQHRDYFKPAVMNQVSAFFETGAMPSEIARSSLVLIPKSDQAAAVGDFRPIFVCNVLYKLISKILAIRLKPYIGGCILRVQSAFLLRREISENVILFREILHSFGLTTYRNKEFCLKVDLSKAFDRMDWDFLRFILPIYNFPSRFANWSMKCITSAEYTVAINGKGDGFFRPQCALRQGCSLSPYMFILGMDVLSRHLAYLVQARDIHGVRISPSAVPLTDCLYADDLLLFGLATVGEA